MDDQPWLKYQAVAAAPTQTPDDAPWLKFQAAPAAAPSLSLAEQARADAQNGVPFWQGASNAMGIPALRAGITKLPFGILQAESEQFANAADAVGSPETAARFRNTAGLMGTEAANEAANLERNKAVAPTAATIANIAPQVGQLVGLGTSLPAIAAGGAISGGLSPKMTEQDLQNAGYKPVNTLVDRTLGALAYLPKKGVEAVAKATDTDPNSRFAKAVEGALTGVEGYGVAKATPAVVGSVVEGAGNRIKGIGADKVDDLAAQSDQNWANASQTIQDAHYAGATLTPDAGMRIFNQVKESVGPLNARHSETAAELADLQKAAESGQLTLSKLDEFRQNFGDVIGDNTKSKIDGGGLYSDGYKAMQAKNAISNSFENFNDSDFAAGSPQAALKLKEGINQWAQASRFDRVADLINRAEGDSTAIQRNFKNFVNKDSNLRGFSDEEIATLRDVAQRGPGQMLERGLGTFGFDLGKVKNIALPALASGSALAVPGGGALAAIGTVLRQTGKYAARGKAQNALDTVMNRNVTPADLRTMSTPEGLAILDQAMKMRGRVNAANSQEPMLPDQLALPAPVTTFVGDMSGNLSPISETNALAGSRQNLQNMGLTPDVLRVQKANQLNAAWEQRLNQQNANKAQEINILAKETAPTLQDMLKQAIQNSAERSAITGEAPSALIDALQQALAKRGTK